MGCVTDSGGKPLQGVEVRVVPLAPNLSFAEDPKPQDSRVFTAVTDENGRYRLDGLAARCGVKEGMYIQGYNIVAHADGHAPRQIHFQKPRRSRFASASSPSRFVLMKRRRPGLKRCGSPAGRPARTLRQSAAASSNRFWFHAATARQFRSPGQKACDHHYHDAAQHTAISFPHSFRRKQPLGALEYPTPPPHPKMEPGFP